MKILKIAAWIVGGLILLVVGVFVLQGAASERVEVVELHTLDAAGEEMTTRLWIVDHEGRGYLRVGADGSGWYSRLRENGEIELTRGGERLRYEAISRPELSEPINALMQAKYTWGDTVIAALVGSRDGSIPIELRPVAKP